MISVNTADRKRQLTPFACADVHITQGRPEKVSGKQRNKVGILTLLLPPSRGPTTCVLADKTLIITREQLGKQTQFSFNVVKFS